MHLPCTPLIPPEVAGPVLSELVPYLCQTSVVSNKTGKADNIIYSAALLLFMEENFKTLMIITAIIHYVLSTLQMLFIEIHSNYFLIFLYSYFYRGHRNFKLMSDRARMINVLLRFPWQWHFSHLSRLSHKYKYNFFFWEESSRYYYGINYKLISTK